MLSSCPICFGRTRALGESATEIEFTCPRCRARFARLKCALDYDITFPGVPCPACYTHDVEGFAHPAEAPLRLEDFVFRCPRTKQLKTVTFDETGLQVQLVD